MRRKNEPVTPVEEHEPMRINYIVGTASKRPKRCMKCDNFKQEDFYYKGVRFIGKCTKYNLCVPDNKSGCKDEETKTVLLGFGEVI